MQPKYVEQSTFAGRKINRTELKGRFSDPRALLGLGPWAAERSLRCSAAALLSYKPTHQLAPRSNQRTAAAQLSAPAVQQPSLSLSAHAGAHTRSTRMLTQKVGSAGS